LKIADFLAGRLNSANAMRRPFSNKRLKDHGCSPMETLVVA
jgi:hypothetical protein